MPDTNMPKGSMNETAIPRSHAVFVLSHQGPNASAGTRAQLTSAAVPRTSPPTKPSMNTDQIAKNTPTNTVSMPDTVRGQSVDAVVTAPR